MRRILLPLFFIFLSPFLVQAEAPATRSQICYLMQNGEYIQALELYELYHTLEGRHDFEALEQLGALLLEKGGESRDPETQLLTLYGCASARVNSALKVIETALKSEHIQTQLAAVQLLGRLDDDRCRSLLHQAMSSNFFYTRMEAAFQLCLRKDRSAVGQIEALMHRVPPPLRAYFPPFFGLIGNREGVRMLRRLLDDRDPMVRLEAILSAAKNGRDDLLPVIRTLATHLNPIEQEVCAFALGALQDSSSLPLLKKLAASHDTNVALAASMAAYRLGDQHAKEKIFTEASKENPYALTLLGDISESEEALLPHLQSPHLQIRFNATLSMLKRRDPRVAKSLAEFLVRDSKDFGFLPAYSPGKAMMIWKALPSARQHQKGSSIDLIGLTLSLREQMLQEALELPEQTFLSLASDILPAQQTELIPLLISLLENLRTPGSLVLLKTHAAKSPSPLIRTYCNLSLFRLSEKGDYAHVVKQWLVNNMGKELIQFRPLSPRTATPVETRYTLTPEENARLLFESCEALSSHHSDESIDLILKMIRKGNPKNRYALAGLLLKTIQ